MSNVNFVIPDQDIEEPEDEFLIHASLACTKCSFNLNNDRRVLKVS